MHRVSSLVNPRCACAASVTVVVLCVCLCLSEKECGDFAETTAFERYGVITSEKSQYTCIYSNQHWLKITSTRCSRSAHRGRIKLRRGYMYVSKSSTALNPPTITQLHVACERLLDVQVADRFVWPSPSISGACACV